MVPTYNIDSHKNKILRMNNSAKQEENSSRHRQDFLLSITSNSCSRTHWMHAMESLADVHNMLVAF